LNVSELLAIARATLASLQTWIGLANYIKPTTPLDDLAITMTIFRFFERREYLHDDLWKMNTNTATRMKAGGSIASNEVPRIGKPAAARHLH